MPDERRPGRARSCVRVADSLARSVSYHGLLRDNMVLWLGMAALNVAAYASQVYVARTLGQRRFGDFVSAVALVSLLFAPAGSIQTIVARRVAYLEARSHGYVIPWAARVWLKRTLVVGFAASILCVISSPRVGASLRLEATWPAVLLVPAAIAGVTLPVPRGMWQGSQQFRRLAANLLLEGIARLAFTMLIATATLNAAAAAAGYGLGAFVAMVCALATMRGVRSSENDLVGDGGDGMAVPTVVASTSLMLLQSIDMLFVKRFFGASDVGHYAAGLFVGKIAIFASSPVPMVMLPKLVRKVGSGGPSGGVFVVSLLLVSVVCAGVLVIPILCPAQFSAALFGPGFGVDRALLLTLGTAATLYSLLTTCANFYFAAGYARIGPIMMGVVLLAGLLLTALHTTLMTVALAMVGSLSAGVAVVAADIIRSRTHVRIPTVA